MHEVHLDKVCRWDTDLQLDGILARLLLPWHPFYEQPYQSHSVLWFLPLQSPVTKESEVDPHPQWEETMPIHCVLSRTRTFYAAVGTLWWPVVQLLAHYSPSWLIFLFILIQKEWSPLSPQGVFSHAYQIQTTPFSIRVYFNVAT